MFPGHLAVREYAPYPSARCPGGTAGHAHFVEAEGNNGAYSRTAKCAREARVRVYATQGTGCLGFGVRRRNTETLKKKH